MKMAVWNLKVFEKELQKEGRSTTAYDLRQVLDKLSPNWRIVEKYEDLVVDEIKRRNKCLNICRLKRKMCWML